MTRTYPVGTIVLSRVLGLAIVTEIVNGLHKVYFFESGHSHFHNSQDIETLIGYFKKAIK